VANSELREVARLVGEIRELVRRAGQLATDNPAAERNLVAILRHIEMLEIEISDPIRVLDQPESPHPIARGGR